MWNNHERQFSVKEFYNADTEPSDGGKKSPESMYDAGNDIFFQSFISACVCHVKLQWTGVIRPFSLHYIKHSLVFSSEFAAGTGWQIIV